MTEPVAIDEQIDAQKEIIAILKNMRFHEAEIEMDEAILSSLIRLQSIESTLTAEREESARVQRILAEQIAAERIARVKAEAAPTVCVPVEPTEEMIKAGMAGYVGSLWVGHDVKIVAAYKAMITAARKP